MEKSNDIKESSQALGISQHLIYNLSNSKLRSQIEEIRRELNEAIKDINVNDSSYCILLGISTRMDKLILEYMKDEVG